MVPKKVIEGKDVLILGPGKSINQNKNLVIRFIKKYKPIVLVLNAINPIQKICFCSYSLPHIKIVIRYWKYKKLNKNLITPYSSFSKI